MTDVKVFEQNLLQTRTIG